MIVHTLPALDDNYFFILESNGQAIAIDPGESDVILSFLSKHSLKLQEIWLTHHHHDHVGGVPGLLKNFSVPVYASSFDIQRLAFPAIPLKDGDILSFHDNDFVVMETPGHTLGHITFYCEDQSVLFCGDTLFSLGCGRLFEGTPEMMFRTLNKLKALPPETKIHCAHEYTLTNFNFLSEKAMTTCPPDWELTGLKQHVHERLRKEGRTIPTSLKFEQANNPFLRSDLETFTRLRELRNHF